METTRKSPLRPRRSRDRRRMLRCIRYSLRQRDDLARGENAYPTISVASSSKEFRASHPTSIISKFRSFLVALYIIDGIQITGGLLVVAFLDGL